MSKSHVFNFYAPVNQQTVGALTNQILEAVNCKGENQAKDLLVKFSSTGGDLKVGFTFYNFIRSLSARIPITVVNMGSIDSIAVIMYLAFENRFSVPTGQFVLHDFHWAFSASTVDHSRLSEYVASLNADAETYIRIFHERTSRAKKTIDIDGCLHGHPLILGDTAAIEAGIVGEITSPEDANTADANEWWVAGN